MEPSVSTDIIEARNLTRDYKIAKRDEGAKYVFVRKYETIHAVKAIDFTVKPGETVGFVGPNGAGKSTAIKMMTGILVPTSGTIRVLGRDPFASRKQNALEIGVVFGQRSQLWWELPISDAFTLLRKLYRVPKEKYEANLKLYKEYLDLESIWNQAVRQLSLGQRMRAEIAAAILHNPPLLFLDEPTVGLDIVAKRQIRAFIKRLNTDYGTTVILTSHDIKDIEEVCERIMLINNGTLTVDCPLAELRSRFQANSVVTVNFEKPLAAFDMPGVTGAPEKDGLTWRFEIDKNITTMGHLVFELSKTAEIVDMQAANPAVEDIIHDLYINENTL